MSRLVNREKINHQLFCLWWKKKTLFQNVLTRLTDKLILDLELLVLFDHHECGQLLKSTKIELIDFVSGYYCLK